MTRAKKTESPPELPPLWTFYRVRWDFLTKLCGSVPADPDLIRAWLNARQPRVRPAGALSIEEINEEVLASIERGEGEPSDEYSMLVFQRLDGALMLRSNTIRAHIKDCAYQLSGQFVGRIDRERTFNTRVKNGVYLDDVAHVGIKGTKFLPVIRPDGSPVTSADVDTYDKAIHVRGPSGTINALKRIEYVEPPTSIEFTLKVLGRSISETDLHHLFMYGGTHGYGGERGDGEGRYSYSLEVGAGSERTEDSHVRRADAEV